MQSSQKPTQQQYFTGHKIKYVKRAKMFCKTFFDVNGEQKREWALHYDGFKMDNSKA